MKAVRWHGRGDVRVDDMPIPVPAPGEVLLQVKYSGICGSEVHEYLAGPIFIPIEPHPLTGSCAPQVMGHEFGGEVVELGKGVTSPQVGDLVVVNPILACGTCAPCRRRRHNLCERLAYYGAIGDGGHRAFTVVKAENCVPVPKGIPLEYLAFGEPAGVAAHAVRQADIKPGATGVVLGGGPLGQLAVQYAKLAGAERVFMTEIAPFRMQLAKRLGVVEDVFSPIETNVVEAVLERTGGVGVDFAIECSGGNKSGMLDDTAAQAVELTRAEGTTVIVGTFAGPTEFHFNNLVLLERKVIGSWVWHTQQEQDDAIRRIVDGSIQVLPMVTDKIPVEKAVSEGIERLHVNHDDHMKILIDFT